MIKPELDILAKIIINQIRTLHEEGFLDDVEPNEGLGYTCEIVFGFSPSEIEGIHTHKIGVGDGVWFRLKDGRVIGGDREESDPDPALYDTVAN